MTNRMARKLNNIIAVFFLLVFLLPSLVKLEHHHENFKCKAINEKHIHIQHEKCDVCNFEFSVFLSDFTKIDFQKETHPEFFCDNYDSVNFAIPSQYSFLLRGPPVILI
jgi:hypothetical protein